MNATVDPFAADEDVSPGYWKITVMDKIPGKGAAGFHLDEGGQPFADVLWSSQWSLTASHECVEMLVDPFACHIVPGPSPIESQGRVNFLVEVADPCEDAQFGYTVAAGTKNEVLVSDFYTPDYFSPTRSNAVRFSFGGNISAPLEVQDGGYLSWRNPADNHIWQQFGRAVFQNFKDNGPGTLNRENTDALARKARTAHAREMADLLSTRAALTEAASNECNLTLDTFTGLLAGTTGLQTTVQITDPNKSAVFVSISYAGTQIGSNVSSASFTIKSGLNDLSFAYDAPVPGDLVNLVDPCGATLDIFANNPGNPLRVRRVNGQ